MSKIELDVLFKKMQKDDKKEVLEFHIIDDEVPHSSQLIEMAGGIAVLEIDENEKLTAEFKKIQRDSKKTVLQFEVKGDNEDKIIELYKLAGSHVILNLEASQMTIDEFYDEDQHEGLDYDIDSGGVVEIKGQSTIFDEQENEDNEDAVTVIPFADSEDDLLN